MKNDETQIDKNYNTLEVTRTESFQEVFFIFMFSSSSLVSDKSHKKSTYFNRFHPFFYINRSSGKLLPRPTPNFEKITE